MLVVSRKRGERIFVGNTSITLTDIRGDKARIGLCAPLDMRVLREEVAAGDEGPADKVQALAGTLANRVMQARSMADLAVCQEMAIELATLVAKREAYWQEIGPTQEQAR